MSTPAERRKLEEEIVGLAIDGLLSGGYSLSIDYGDGLEFPPCTDKEKILTNLWACDEELIMVFAPHNVNKMPNSSVFLVHGNDGWDVICDHGISLNEPLTAAMKRAEEMSSAAH